MTWRLPLRESTSGRCNSIVPRATRAAPISQPRFSERARDFLGREGLEKVPRLHSVDAVHADAALETGQHLAHVVLEALERSDRARSHDRVAAAHAHLGGTDELALLDVRAGDRAEL